MLKKYKTEELGESGSRRPSYDAKTEYAKSSKSKCKKCNMLIQKGELRIALMLQDEEGYKNTAWMHFECFWKHKETKKLNSLDEIVGIQYLKKSDLALIRKRWNEEFIAKEDASKAKNKPEQREEIKFLNRKIKMKK